LYGLKSLLSLDANCGGFGKLFPTCAGLLAQTEKAVASRLRNVKKRIMLL